MTAVSIAGVPSSSAVPELEVLRVRRQLVGGRRDRFVEVPGRPGSWVFPEEPGDRSLTVECHLFAATFDDRRDAVRRLAAWADTPAGAVAIIVDDEPDRFYYGVLADAPVADEWLRAGELELTYRVSPYTYDVAVSSSTAATGLPSAASGVVDVGTLDFTVEPELELVPRGGTLTSLTLTLAGDTLSWSGLVLADDALTVSTISSTVTVGTSDDAELVGVYDPDAVDMADVDGRFPLLETGENAYNIVWTGTATTLDITVRWRRRFR